MQMTLDTYLLDRLEVILHTRNGDVLASLDALSLEHLGKSAFTLLANESVLLHFIYLDSNARTLFCCCAGKSYQQN